VCSALAQRADDLRRLARTDPDPRLRRRAHALLLVAEGHPVAAVLAVSRAAKELRRFCGER